MSSPMREWGWLGLYTPATRVSNYFNHAAREIALESPISRDPRAKFSFP